MSSALLATVFQATGCICCSMSFISLQLLPLSNAQSRPDPGDVSNAGFELASCIFHRLLLQPVGKSPAQSIRLGSDEEDRVSLDSADSCLCVCGVTDDKGPTHLLNSQLSVLTIVDCRQPSSPFQ